MISPLSGHRPPFNGTHNQSNTSCQTENFTLSRKITAVALGMIACSTLAYSLGASTTLIFTSLLVGTVITVISVTPSSSSNQNQERQTTRTTCHTIPRPRSHLDVDTRLALARQNRARQSAAIARARRIREIEARNRVNTNTEAAPQGLLETSQNFLNSARELRRKYEERQARNRSSREFRSSLNSLQGAMSDTYRSGVNVIRTHL